MKDNKQKITGLLFLGILLIGMFGSILIKDDVVSYAERRYLQSLPDFSIDAILKGEYMKELDTYFLDHFIGRDIFRTIKAEFDLLCLGKKDSNGYYLSENHIFEIQTETNLSNVVNAGNKFEMIVEQYFPTAHIYYSIIPEKSYFIPEIPQLDFAAIEEIMAEQFTSATYISVNDHLELNDYYDTDLHWKQEEIIPIAQHLLLEMGQANNTLSTNQIQLISDSFLGGYGVSSAFFVEKDNLYCVNNDIIKNAVVFDYETQKQMEIYTLDKLEGMDAYDIYLGGAKALLTIEVQDSQVDRELLLFRDSFGSSIAPLLLEGYSKITIIDLRYVTIEYAVTLLGEREYDDVLFLYNTLLLHNSHSMKF